MAYKSRKSNPYAGGPGGPGKKSTRPAVTAENTAKYTDWEKKDKALHGAGAKLFPSNTAEGQSQKNVATGRVTDFRQKHNEWPTYPNQVKAGLAAMPAKPGQSGGVVQNNKKKY